MKRILQCVGKKTGKVYEYPATGKADDESLEREFLRYGCTCKTDHGKTPCEGNNEIFSSVKVIYR